MDSESEVVENVQASGETPNLEPLTGEGNHTVMPVMFATEGEKKEREEKKELMGFMAASVKNPWLCPNGHLLGMIVRQKTKGGGKISRLYILRVAFHSNQVVPENMVFAIVDSGRVACSICGEAREWRPGADFVAQLQNKRA